MFWIMLNLLTHLSLARSSHDEPNLVGRAAAPTVAPAEVICRCRCFSREVVLTHFERGVGLQSRRFSLCAGSRPLANIELVGGRSASLVAFQDANSTCQDRSWDFAVSTGQEPCSDFDGLACTGWIYEFYVFPESYRPVAKEGVTDTCSRRARLRSN